MITFDKFNSDKMGFYDLIDNLNSDFAVHYSLERNIFTEITIFKDSSQVDVIDLSDNAWKSIDKNFYNWYHRTYILEKLKLLVEL